ncbi:hypothetical protein BCV69DRAFT_271307 [Microstroma glucosiphilum]|uniref:M-phase inducer phosphatase n=1 Tax=Pseudomicrostroma glucosiphilum TaxID=1684307 RepID=A0A316U431_9BASI|nr:hypothetical protein BCV69DRAFT_271307 [Pseudomicrostroma glucosiphilum]PWN20039.1 hypothetical protein BCV69DRAFT_271307 [Pseudomicrostroma glucosiphilum]
MMALLSSPMGPAMRFDIFDQPSSPTRRHEELPADFDRSFGSSMSLGSSFDQLPRVASQQSDGRASSGQVFADLPVSSSSSSQSIRASSTRLEALQSANPFALSAPSSPTSSPSASSPSMATRSKARARGPLPTFTSSPSSSRLPPSLSESPTMTRTLGASMGTELSSKSPGLAAKMSSPHYMDFSPTNPLASSSKPSGGSNTPSSAAMRHAMLPPGSAMKEDTPPMSARRRVSSRPSSRNGSTSRGSGHRASPDLSNCAGSKLGRLFGTNMSLNTMNTQASPGSTDNSFENSQDGDASYEKEQPPAKRRPSSLPLGEGRPFVRPGLRTAMINGVFANRRVPSLLSTFHDEPTRRSSTDVVGRSQSPADQSQDRRRPRSRVNSNDGAEKEPVSSFAQSIRERQEAMGLTSAAFATHATIIESPSPGSLERQDLGSYFFDPQSPEARQMANASLDFASFSEAASPSSGFGIPRTTSGNQVASVQAKRPSLGVPNGGSPARAFVKAHSTAVVSTRQSFSQEQPQSRSLLGKRLNPHHANRRPSTLIQEQRRCHKSAQAVLGVADAAGSSRDVVFPRLTAPAPRRCHSSFEPFAASGGLLEPMLLGGESAAAGGPCSMLDSSSAESIDMMASSDSTGDTRFPDGFDANGSPMAPSMKSRATRRPTFARQSSKDDVSPLGYGSRRQRERTGLNGLQEDVTSPNSGDGKMSSPFSSSEGMPGFGASERSGKVLPCFNVKEDGLMRITPQTLVSLMQGQYNDQIESYQVVDCRFGYEHQGGHIPGAINLSTVDRVKNYFLTKNCNTSPRGRELPPRSQSGRADCFGNTRKPILVFHCEFSAKRAPSMALALRQADRSLASDYPNCHYPELYILEGGYCGFFKTYEEICEPQAYVRMDDPAHVQMRSTELNGFRKQFSRHRSFTYGDAQAAAKQVSGNGSGNGKEGNGKEGNGRPNSFFAMAMAGQSGNHTSRESTLGLPQHNLHNPKRRSALGQHVDGPNQSMCSEEESSFETDSPSNLAAVKKQSTASAGGFLLPESGSTGDTSFDSNESFELGKPPVLLLRAGAGAGGAAAAASASGTAAGGSGSGSGSQERSLGDSPCAAAGSRRSGAGAMLLGVPKAAGVGTGAGAGTGGAAVAAGTLPPRRPFVRAGTTGGLFGR